MTTRHSDTTRSDPTPSPVGATGNPRQTEPSTPSPRRPVRDDSQTASRHASQQEQQERSLSDRLPEVAGVDAHCHLDHYPDPLAMSHAVNAAHLLTVAVTRSPAAFQRAYPHVRALRSIRLAVGLHPLDRELHEPDPARARAAFRRCLAQTSYVGEVGLDFTAAGRAWREAQIATFRFVLTHLARTPKFVSIHSRGAEATVLDLLEEYAVGPVVFHWYTGSRRSLQRLLTLGHYCSVTPAMVRTKNGRALVAAMPPERVLSETDGPFCRVDGRRAEPHDVCVVEQELAALWGIPSIDVRARIWQNLLAVVPGARA